MTDLSRFRGDVDEVPSRLRELASVLDGAGSLVSPGAPMIWVGMGSSWFAAATAARHARAAGVHVVAEIASCDDPPVVPGATLVAISAGGSSAETLAAVDRIEAASTIALTNRPSSPLAERCAVVADLAAGEEASGVACRTYRHTLALLLALALPDRAPRLAEAARRAADASEDLLARADTWLPSVADALAGPAGTWVVAPATRWSSAEQGALMLREVPRRQADACETGDWSHVDVYLTKTLDYRLLLLSGSSHEPEMARWVQERRPTVVAVGPTAVPAAVGVRHLHDDDVMVRLLTEPLVCELVAWRWALG